MASGGKSVMNRRFGPGCLSETTRGSCLHFDGVQDMHDFNYSTQTVCTYKLLCTITLDHVNDAGD